MTATVTTAIRQSGEQKRREKSRGNKERTKDERGEEKERR
jgi:hypothetical protein